MNANYEAREYTTFSIFQLLFPLDTTTSVYTVLLIWETKFHTHTKQLAEFLFCVFWRLYS
jgi:hypothetical protein